MDLHLITPLFQEITVMLDEGFSESDAKLAEIQNFMRGTDHESTLTRIKEQIENYDYEEALETLTSLAHSLEIPLVDA